MRKIFEAELQALGDDLEQMAELVLKAITGASNALQTQDLTLAQQVIADDQAIDALERDLDERCVLLLAQQQPVATDLRVIVSVLRMSASLERMGDLARHIAEVSRRAFPNPGSPSQLRDTYEQMGEAAQRVAQRVYEIVTSHDLEEAGSIERDDDLLDELHNSVFTTVLGPDWKGSAQETVDATLLSRYFERFGDHGVSVARRVQYLVTGEFGPVEA
ncbi:phosphate signaling complex protein PhoU [Populibacterium corticicola]|jgi:phosphate transport system protein|uniref:Phosphate-specific transport system accessory protein PhoU n=1 Tax=Populibacterium corticicola TaxID=1812826 RepID=A0ABW5XJ85_9MICO